MCSLRRLITIWVPLNGPSMEWHTQLWIDSGKVYFTISNRVSNIDFFSEKFRLWFQTPSVTFQQFRIQFAFFWQVSKKLKFWLQTIPTRSINLQFWLQILWYCQKNINFDFKYWLIAKSNSWIQRSSFLCLIFYWKNAWLTLFIGFDKPTRRHFTHFRAFQGILSNF